MKVLSKVVTTIGLIGCLLLVVPSIMIAQGDYNGPSTSGGNNTYHEAEHSKEVKQAEQDQQRKDQPVVREPTQEERERSEGVVESPLDRAKKQWQELHEQNPDGLHNEVPAVAH